MELKKGNYLEDKDGDLYVVTDVEYSFGEIVRIKDGECFPCGNLSHNIFLDLMDIEKVYEDSNLEKVIWERKKDHHFTDLEIDLMQNAKISGDSITAISRDLKGKIYFWTGKGHNIGISMEVYNHLFKCVECGEEIGVEEILEKATIIQ